MNHSPRQKGFTLVELLVVISIIGVLAALSIPVLRSLKRNQYLRVAVAELSVIDAAIQNYHTRCGVYPPGNPSNASVNPLFYELSGTTLTNGNFRTLDGSSTINAAALASTFNVNGVVNCSKGSGDDAVPAVNFLTALNSRQVADNGAGVKLLVTSVHGPDAGYQPIGIPEVNPIHYNSTTPTNSPGSYDLWIDLSINGKTNRVCNWSRQVQIVP